jgi:ribosome-associated translation inhibitor RaiA
MKLRIDHHHHRPSSSFISLVASEIETLRALLQIDEARVTVERRLEASPAFRVAAHLVTPGPDIRAEAIDHTLCAALYKLVGGLSDRIGHRHQKRVRRVRSKLLRPRSGLPRRGLSR